MRRILATDFGIWPAFKDLASFSDAMVASSPHRAQLANYLLLYDQLVIPTGNLQILPVLRLILGDDVFSELVRTRGLVLARFDQWFGYQGTKGLSLFKVGAGKNRHPNAAHSFFLPFDQALHYALNAFNPPTGVQGKASITSLLLENVIHLPSADILSAISDETYLDINSSPYLQALLALRNAGNPLDKLSNLPESYFSIFNPHLAQSPDDIPEIQAVLRVAFENFLLKLGSHVSATDLTGDEATLSLLRAKGQRIGFAVDGVNAFAQLQQVSGIPDIGEAFALKQLSPTQILDLRCSKHAQSLRDWFAAGSSPEGSKEIVARYTEAVQNPSLIETLPAKLLRFAVTSGIGALEPISGAISSAVDTFLLSKWFPVASPRLFMKQAKVMLRNSPVVRSPVIKGRDRNELCSCGSGKKLKKCCGKLSG